MVDRADHRIGDTERQQAIDLLRAHAGAGRLTLDEFSDLAGDVFAAQTYGELDAVGRKLPPGLVLRNDDGQAPAAAAGTAAGTGPSDPTGTAPGTRPAAAPAAGSPAAATPQAGGGRRTVVAIMCGAHPRGTWRPAARMRAFAIWGGAHIDLRRAVMPGPVVDITAWAVMGGVTITVAEGTRVELDGLVIMGGSHNATRRSEPTPDAPLVRVHARGMWGGVTVRNPSRRRHRHDRASVHGSHAVGHGRDTAEARDHVADHAGSLLELPQRVLDDLDALLHDRMRPSARVPRPGSAWPPPPADAPPAEASRPAPAPDVSARRPSGTLTMMVTDVADSTRLAERLGDQRWIGVIAEHNTLVREQVGRHGGTEVKALGDGFLVVFPSARRAILAAVEVQQALARFRDTRPETPVAVRIGLHTGEIVDVDGDVLGQNVVVASRIADKAAPGEIVVSGVTRDLTVSGGDITFGPADDVELKGLSDRWRIHRVAWSPAAPEAPAAWPS
jgi:class 3 adenylate cyclase